jgi:nucleoside-diphosphate-sugar epimerase
MMNVENMREISKQIDGGYVFLHLAWPVSKENYLYSKDNIDFLNQSKELMQLLGDDVNCKRIIGVGSILEHGNIQDVTDNSPLNPESTYAESKVNLANFLRLSHGDKSKWIRIGYQISAHDPRRKLVPVLLANSSYPNPLKTPYKFLDLIHRFDVAEAILAFIKNCSAIEGFNALIATGRGIALYEFANEFLEIKIPPSEQFEFYQTTNPQILKTLGWSAGYLTIKELTQIIYRERADFNFVPES